MSSGRGFFAAIDGPSGIGKTTVVHHLAQLLNSQGFPVFATREPTDTPLGDLARFGTDDYHGITLACLVAADRYQHLEREIRPALDAGKIVLTDRYIASTLVLQRLDAVAPEYLWLLNQYADQPDLYVILSGNVTQARQRATRRGRYSRFHGGGQKIGAMEAALYISAASELVRRGFKLVVHDTTRETPDDVAETLAALIVDEWSHQTDGA